MSDKEERPKQNKTTRRRRPRIDTLLAEAAMGGKTVTSIELPDGTKLTFGEGEQTSTSSNPWLKELTKQ
jgi:hypothetical protein